MCKHFHAQFDMSKKYKSAFGFSEIDKIAQCLWKNVKQLKSYNY